MRVLITGNKGFTGRYLEEEFTRAGWEVFGLGVQPDSGGNRYRQIDLLDTAELQKWILEVRPDAVAHLAAVAFVAHEAPDAFYRINMIGTRNLLESLAMLPRRPSSVLLASSANVYGRNAASPITELHEPNPANDYAVSKLGMEYVARLYTDRLPLFFTRPFNYTGVGQASHFLVPKIVEHFARRLDTIELGNLDVSRDFSDVRAVATAYRRLIERSPAGSMINVCSGVHHSIAELINICSTLTGHKISVISSPQHQRAQDIAQLWGSNARLRELLPGWNSPPIEQTLSWMLENATSGSPQL